MLGIPYKKVYHHSPACQASLVFYRQVQAHSIEWEPMNKSQLNIVLILLIIVLGAAIVWPYHDYQNLLSQGDHGRDLYAAQAVLEGQRPYQDFWWVYGPLMPYYYGLCFKLLGSSIASILVGQLIIKIITGVFAYLALATLFHPLTALLGALWSICFLQDFFFTYNHVGGVVFIMAVVWLLFCYIKKPETKYIYAALLSALLLGLIKINFSFCALLLIALAIPLRQWLCRHTAPGNKKILYALTLIGVPSLLIGIYWLLLNGLTLPEARQCLPYMNGDQPYEISPFVALKNFFQIIFKNMFSSWLNTLMAAVIIASSLRTAYVLWRKQLPPARQTVVQLALIILSLFYALNFHEYLKSGVWYRSFWSQPLSVLITFVLVDTAIHSITSKRKWLGYAPLILVLGVSWFNGYQILNSVKQSSQYLDIDGAHVYLQNQPGWIKAVKDTTAFLKANVPPDELFFALPYDCLYYFLTHKKTPTRQLIFFDHIKIPSTQEESIIADLEKNHVNYVLLSNRAFAHTETGLGMFGKTYCPLIDQYIQAHFVPIARFGDWRNEPGWGWNHGTLILKRKTMMTR